MKIIKLICLLFTVSLLVVGCTDITNQVKKVPPNGVSTQSSLNEKNDKKPDSQNNNSEGVSSSKTINDSGKTLIKKISVSPSNQVSTLIVSSKGTVIACDPMSMPKDIKPDIILVTHDHHLEESYYEKFPEAKILKINATELEYEDIKIKGIAASHTEANINTKYPNFVIYTIEVDNLRIAYFACLGQKDFSEEQLDSLGKIDIAMITTDEYTGYISVDKASALIEQLNPKVFIPLSHNYKKYSDVISSLEKTFGESYKASGKLEVDSKNLEALAHFKLVDLVWVKE